VKNRKLDAIKIIHRFGHDLVVLKGSKRVWNLSKKAKNDPGIGDYLFTPAGDVHRVKYFEDTEFFFSSGKGNGISSLMKRWRLLRVKLRRKQGMGLS
jgi:hypothetical protein